MGLAVSSAVVRLRPFRVEVRGDSMVPTLLPGDRALALRRGPFRRGQVVVVEHPRRPGLDMVKRLAGLPGDRAPTGARLGPDQWWIEGDWASRSTDSRTLGPVPGRAIKGKVLLVYWPPRRWRAV